MPTPEVLASILVIKGVPALLQTHDAWMKMDVLREWRWTCWCSVLKACVRSADDGSKVSLEAKASPATAEGAEGGEVRVTLWCVLFVINMNVTLWCVL